MCRPLAAPATPTRPLAPVVAVVAAGRPAVTARQHRMQVASDVAQAVDAAGPAAGAAHPPAAAGSVEPPSYGAVLLALAFPQPGPAQLAAVPLPPRRPRSGWPGSP